MEKIEIAMRIWPVLITAAKKRKKLTYSELGEQIGLYRLALRHGLGVIQDYCLENNLPPLTALVVLQEGGKPSLGFTAAPAGSENAVWKTVWDYTWPAGNPFLSPPNAPTYWVLACNPKKWAVDRFLADGIRSDEWGVRKSDKAKFAPGQLALVRVGVDQRNRKERKGRPKLAAGIYAICQIESFSYAGSGTPSKYGNVHPRGWPTVPISYLRTFENHPLTIEQLKAKGSNLSSHLLNGLQASSFPISEPDFRTVVELMGLEFDELGNEISPDDLKSTTIEKLLAKYSDAAPSVKERVSRAIERGPIGAIVKKANNYQCQICSALGQSAKGFAKPDGVPYVEAHHVIPVSTMAPGSLSHANVISVCANHHRELHYGTTTIHDLGTAFQISVHDGIVQVQKHSAQ